MEDRSMRHEPTKCIPFCAKYAPNTLPNSKNTKDQSSFPQLYL